MDKDDIDVFKENIVEYKSKRYFKSFSKIMKDAKKYLKKIMWKREFLKKNI